MDNDMRDGKTTTQKIKQNMRGFHDYLSIILNLTIALIIPAVLR